MVSTRFGRRRVAAVAVAAVAATLTLAACGTDNGGSDKPSGDATLSNEKVTLSMDWWGADSRVKLTQQVIDAFEKKYPNITVEPQYSDWNSYWDKLATSTAGGNAPDVMQMDQLYLASYAQKDALADLSTVSSQLDTSHLPAAVLGMGKYNGKQYAMPISTTGFGVVINKTILDNLGLTLPDTDKWTWQQFEDFAASISKASGGKIVGASPLSNEFSLQLWTRQHGEGLFTGNKITASQATIASYFQQALDFQKSGASASASRYTEQAALSIDQTDFSQGKQAMIFTQATQLTQYTASTKGANLILAKLPTDDANTAKYAYLKPGMYWAVSSKSKHPAEAAALVNFFVNDPDAGKILGTERGIPANPDIVTAITPNLTAPEKASVEYTNSLSGILGDAPAIVPNGASQLDSIIGRDIGEVLFKRQTPDSAAKNFLIEVQADIDNAQ